MKEDGRNITEELFIQEDKNIDLRKKIPDTRDKLLKNRHSLAITLYHICASYNQ